jgi:hypothetical protein
MKLTIPLAAVTAAAILALGLFSATAQARRGAEKLTGNTLTANPAAEEALSQALLGPDGEYAAQAEYEAILQKFGQVQPYASIIKSEECHIAALKRHLEMRGLAAPENPYTGKIQVPATLKEAADAGIAAEQRNVALYDQLLEQIKDQPDLVRVFTHLQRASRECHLPAFQAAAAKDGQLAAGELICGAGGCGAQRRGAGGPPAWAGARGCGGGQGAGCGGCPLGVGAQGGSKAGPGYGKGRGFGRGGCFQGQ